MATLLNKEITRETTIKVEDREIQITLTEDQKISMKLKGMKSGTVTIDIGDLYKQLIQKEEVKNEKELSDGMLVSLHDIRHRSNVKGFDYSATSSFKLLLSAYNSAIKKNIPITVGNCFSSDYFYNPLTDLIDYLDKMQILCIEMEAAGLFGVAAEYNANALAILTISDEIRTHKSISAEERQTKLNNMIEIALNMENI